jgi:diaminopimelate decarboxylase
MDTLRFLTSDHITTIRGQHQTPLFVYSEQILREQARKVMQFPHHFGLTARYAMKTSSNANIIKILTSE